MGDGIMRLEELGVAGALLEATACPTGVFIGLTLFAKGDWAFIRGLLLVVVVCA